MFPFAQSGSRRRILPLMESGTSGVRRLARNARQSEDLAREGDAIPGSVGVEHHTEPLGAVGRRVRSPQSPESCFSRKAVVLVWRRAAAALHGKQQSVRSSPDSRCQAKGAGRQARSEFQLKSRRAGVCGSGPWTLKAIPGTVGVGGRRATSRRLAVWGARRSGLRRGCTCR